MHNHKKATRRSASRVDGLERGVVPMRALGIVRNFRFREQSDVLEYLSGFEFQDKALLVEWALEAARKTAGAFPQCTKLQRFAVALYTSNNGTDAGNYHTLLNQRLRERRLEPILPLVYLTDTAIHLMGGWQGTVYRGVGFLADLERYQIGAVVCWAQVNSTTTNKAMATDTFMFGKPDRTLFVITVIDGADIRRVSLNPSECEVLLPVCSEFEVKSVEHSAPGSPGPAALTIHLEQLPTPPLFLRSPPRPHREVQLTGRITRERLVECLSGPPGTVVDLREAEISQDDWDGAEAATALAAIGVSGLRVCGLSEERVLGLVRKAHAITFTHLELVGCQMTDAGVTVIAQHCTGLTDLNLFGCSQMTDAGVTAIANRCTGLTNLSLKDHLQVTDAGVTAIANRCTGLTDLTLYGCEQVTDAGVTAIANRCTGLTNLNLFWCRQVTDAGVTAIANRCTGLTDLTLYGCEQVTDAGVTAIANRCTGLTDLNLFWCFQVTDAGVTAIANRCTGLTDLNLFGCSQMTDAGVTAIANRCTGLTDLSLH
eukprot:TRINITY_DN2747_c0_g1_i12.p1 TRINITY_DN2747_c0_g1~~TRINITY_DN2747_c0_g1_i12.p1  ORF type:complete len:542 (+),score=109.86 TRINITY_DN2747_c0_g1_i12:144-1769(+)